MLILENTTFRPDTLYSMRQAFESESINDSFNMTQLKPGKYHCMLFFIFIFHCNRLISLFEQKLSWATTADRKSKNCYIGSRTTSWVRINDGIKNRNNHSSSNNNNNSWIEKSNDGWWNVIDSKKNELCHNANKYYRCTENKKNILRNQLKIHAN